ncbi:MAG: carboxymuconolactone decarboxylase family protein [Acetobacteraceae bacterium]|nr:carboxymuconolactone decarboxylase family protein [Acetobacteraceae bacterium]
MPYQQDLFDKGIEVRRAVLGKDYVDASLARADEFLMAFQNITTEMCWGYVWARPGLDRRTRSLLNLAMLTALSKPAELKLHVRGAIANGLSVDEIKEVLLHATVYCGIPAGLEAFKAAHEVLRELGLVPPASPSPASPSPASPSAASPAKPAG